MIMSLISLSLKICIKGSLARMQHFTLEKHSSIGIMLGEYGVETKPLLQCLQSALTPSRHGDYASIVQYDYTVRIGTIEGQ